MYHFYLAFGWVNFWFVFLFLAHVFTNCIESMKSKPLTIIIVGAVMLGLTSAMVHLCVVGLMRLNG